MTPEHLSGLERKDHVVRNVRLVRHWLNALVNVGADCRCQAAPEPSRGRVLVLEGDLPASRMSPDSRLCRRPTNARAALRADDEELVESTHPACKAVDEGKPDRPGST
jgi:hypothetical protein